ncbi:MAG: NADH:ubiquinone reductase (Na(+)-transporting) subunit A, partial [Flavobacteriia bacterium]|nr:NADH:ubiquinone reductase (Na(+)-transporting) subunit A [Flavobacteriia bacterium]
MSRLVSIHKGLDIRLQGLAEKQLKILPNSRIICISPLDFHGLNPKLL